MNEHLVPSFVLHADPRELYVGRSFVAVDLETDTTDKGSALNESNDIVCACWQVWRDGVVEKKEIVGGIYDMQPLLDDIASVDYVMAMNAKFELGWLKRCGLELRDVLVYDPMLAQWALDANQRKPRSLNGLARRYGTAKKLDLPGLLMEAGISTRDIPTKWLLEYCRQDVEVLVQVVFKQWEELDNQNIWHLAHTRNLTCPVLTDMEFVGLKLNPEKVMKAYGEAVSRREELRNRLAELTGGVNLNSPKQLASFLYDVMKFPIPKDYRGKELLTKKGVPSTNANVMALLKPLNEDQAEFLTKYKEFNKLNALISKNLEYFKLTVEQKDGRFFGNILQNVVETGRLASRGIAILFDGLKKPKSVQLQNIPRQFKELFYSGDPDRLTLEVDGSQLEFRVAVDMGHDKVGLKEIEDGTDVHSFTAQVLEENGDPEICSLPSKKEKRQQSKKSTFRPLYGGSSGSPAIVAYCEYFKDKYEGISETQREWALQCASNGYFTTPYGMTFHFPDTKIQRSGYITNTTSIYNFPVQGFATGEIIPIALVYFWHKTKELDIDIYLTVHDSIISSVSKGDAEEAVMIAKQCLTMDVYKHLDMVYNYKFVVPLGLGAKIGTCWGDNDAPERKWDVWPSGVEIERS